MQIVRSFIIISFVLLISGMSVAAQKGVKVNVELSPAGSFEIKSPKLSGKVVTDGTKYAAKDISIRVRDLKTGIDLRDNHLHKKLQIKQYPKIRLHKAVGKNGAGQGVLEVAGVKHKIPFSFQTSGKFVIVNFELDLNLFKIGSNNYMGVGVEDKVKVAATLPLRKVQSKQKAKK